MVRFTQEPQEDERFSGTVSLSLSPRERELELLRGVTALVFVRLGGQQGTVLPVPHFGARPTHHRLHIQGGRLPWPAPSGAFNLPPEKQVRHWNVSVISAAQELRAGFKTKWLPESLQGVLNVLIKTFSVYLIVHVTEKREDFKHLLPCCGFTCLTPHLSWAWLQSQLLTWTWHNCWEIPALASAACKILPQPHTVTLTPLTLY